MADNFYTDYHEDSPNISFTQSEANVALIKSYLWMFLGTLLTFLVGVASSRFLLNIINADNSPGMGVFLFIFAVCFVVELILGVTINKNALQKAKFTKSLVQFLIYSLLNGITFSFLFAILNIRVLYLTFAGVAVYFLLLTGLSYLFRNKISKLSGFAFVGLITLLIVSSIATILAFVFLRSDVEMMQLFLIVTILGILVFSILTMVDAKSMYNLINNGEHKNAASIAAAFALYLDFINLFIYILRLVAIFGGGKKK